MVGPSGVPPGDEPPECPRGPSTPVPNPPAFGGSHMHGYISLSPRSMLPVVFTTAQQNIYIVLAGAIATPYQLANLPTNAHQCPPCPWEDLAGATSPQCPLPTG